MNQKEIKKLIKEYFKDLALKIYEMDYEDRKSLLAEYKEWIIKDLNLDDILMLPYEAYTNDLIEEKNQEELY
tara:strand:- start:963 stop:1178 length:216 start_codon:yes stop_codon:yes gene_type:complete